MHRIGIAVPGIASALLLFLASTGSAQAPIPYTSFGTDVMSSYVWRGGVVDDEISVQPSVDVALPGTGFTLGLWSAFAARDREFHDGADEIDVTLAWEAPLGVGPASPSLSLGYVQYAFPNAPDGYRHSEEFVASLSLPGPVAPSAMVAHDFGLADATYFAAAIDPEIAWPNPAVPPLALHASIGVSDAGHDFGFHDVTFTAGLPWSVGIVSVQPTAGYTIADETINPDETHAWGGVSINVGN